MKVCAIWQQSHSRVPIVPKVYPVESSRSFYIFCGLVVTVVGIGGGGAAAADGYVAGVAVILISIPLAGLCFATALRD